MHGVDVVRIGRHHRAIGHLRIVQASCLMMPQGDMKRMSVSDSSIFANCARTYCLWRQWFLHRFLFCPEKPLEHDRLDYSAVALEAMLPIFAAVLSLRGVVCT